MFEKNISTLENYLIDIKNNNASSICESVPESSLSQSTQKTSIYEFVPQTPLSQSTQKNIFPCESVPETAPSNFIEKASLLESVPESSLSIPKIPILETSISNLNTLTNVFNDQDKNDTEAFTQNVSVIKNSKPEVIHEQSSNKHEDPEICQDDKIDFVEDVVKSSNSSEGWFVKDNKNKKRKNYESFKKAKTSNENEKFCERLRTQDENFYGNIDASYIKEMLLKMIQKFNKSKCVEKIPNIDDRYRDILSRLRRGGSDYEEDSFSERLRSCSPSDLVKNIIEFVDIKSFGNKFFSQYDNDLKKHCYTKKVFHIFKNLIALDFIGEFEF